MRLKPQDLETVACFCGRTVVILLSLMMKKQNTNRFVKILSASERHIRTFNAQNV